MNAIHDISTVQVMGLDLYIYIYVYMGLIVALNINC